MDSCNTLLSGETIVITGGGTGLGRAMAIRFAELGATVIVCGRREEPLKEVTKQLRSINNNDHSYKQCNVREPLEVSELFSYIREKYKTATALVNNAAGNFLAKSESISPKGFRAIVETVLFGTFYCSTEFAKTLFKTNVKGKIVSIVTTYAFTGSAYVVPSAVSKAGVVALTRSLAVEWAPRIRVNAVAPGIFPTEGAWSRLVPKEIEDKIVARIPLKRVGKPQEVANLVAFLISDLSEFINGEIVTIDGGEWLMAGQFNHLKYLDDKTLDTIFTKLRTSKKQ